VYSQGGRGRVGAKVAPRLRAERIKEAYKEVKA